MDVFKGNMNSVRAYRNEEEKKESMKGTSKSYQNNLREIVKKEIQSLNNDKNEKEQNVQKLMESEIFEINFRSVLEKFEY